MVDSAASGRTNGLWRSFRVEAHAGRKVAGWPFSRFEVGPEGLRVRLGFPWFITRSASKDVITGITGARNITGIYCLRFEDAGRRLADVHVHLVLGGQRVLDELLRCGYAVADRKSLKPATRVARRWRAG